MSMLHMGTNFKPSGGRQQERRIVRDRRVSHGRRNMVRFDKTGGDRRSGYARRVTDEGFRKQTDED
ncbi:MAG: hypothetical protein BMS9Abin19_0417 [Gammaproteobacteria bacterium]|nr:MAG: hypothetical protein BMS9Abin19_0417 [Gammaproteobacteria bacterium]